MKLRIRWAKRSGKHPWASLLLRIGLVAVAAIAMVFVAVSGWFYFKYGRIVDERLKQPVFANTAKIYAAPREVRTGQKLSIHLIANELREAGYSVDGAPQVSPLGTYSENGYSIAVHPGPQSYHEQDGATIRVGGGAVDSITDDHGQPLASYELEPLLITGLSEDANRTKRRLISYNEIPPNMVQAVLAIEEREFHGQGIGEANLHAGGNVFRQRLAMFFVERSGFQQKAASHAVCAGLFHQFLV